MLFQIPLFGKEWQKQICRFKNQIYRYIFRKTYHFDKDFVVVFLEADGNMYQQAHIIQSLALLNDSSFHSLLKLCVHLLNAKEAKVGGEDSTGRAAEQAGSCVLPENPGRKTLVERERASAVLVLLMGAAEPQTPNQPTQTGQCPLI